jgi:DNA-binding protein H-NS
VDFSSEEIFVARAGLGIGKISSTDGTSPSGKYLVVSAYNHENGMRKLNPATMRFEELWQLYEKLAEVLAVKITAEKRELEERLAKLDRVEIIGDVGSNLPLSLSLAGRAPRRKYPKVLPKYRNPLAPSQKWSGRGKRPRWVIAALEAGQRLDDLKIRQTKNGDRKGRPRGRRT